MQALQAASSISFQLRTLPAADRARSSSCIFGPARFGPKEVVIVASATAVRCAAATRCIGYQRRVLLIAASGGAASCVFDQLRAAGATGRSYCMGYQLVPGNGRHGLHLRSAYAFDSFLIQPPAQALPAASSISYEPRLVFGQQHGLGFTSWKDRRWHKLTWH